MKKLLRWGLVVIVAVGSLFLEKVGIELPQLSTLWEETSAEAQQQEAGDSLKEVIAYLDTTRIATYRGVAYVEIHDNQPFFHESEYVTEAFEEYSNLDKLGRCGSAYACIGKEIMPTEEREAIGQIKPSGWHTVKYPEIIADRYLYNRCHLIAFSLAGENANEKNLITGTRYMNVEGMLPFEITVAEYVEETGNHVMYRVTPVFSGSNLVADGVIMEAYSVEDEGAGVNFCVYVYNVQPGVKIDYETGESWAE